MAANEVGESGQISTQGDKDLIRLLAYGFGSFISCLRQDSLLVAEGSTSRYSYCFLSEKWAATQTVRCESESRIGEEISRGPVNAGFRPRTLALAKRCVSKM